MVHQINLIESNILIVSLVHTHTVMDAVIAHILICEIIVIIPIDWDINSIQNNYFVFFFHEIAMSPSNSIM